MTVMLAGTYMSRGEERRLAVSHRWIGCSLQSASRMAETE